MEKKSNRAKGIKFEEEVKDLFDLMGYETIQNYGLKGSEIDIYAHKKGTIIEEQYLIECKAYSEKIGVTIVREFLGLLSLVNNKFHGIIVSPNGFTPEAYDMTRDNKKITLISYQQLLGKLIDFNQYLKDIIEQYEKSDVSKYYISLDCSPKNKPQRLSLEDYVQEWIYSNKKEDKLRNHLSILGDYGTGKTTFLEKLAHDLAIKYLKDPDKNRIPIFIPLRDYQKRVDIHSLITDHLVNQHGILNGSFAIFDKLLKAGKLIILLDGFDEMAIRMDRSTMEDNLRELENFVHPINKVILSCRTAYFTSRKQEEQYLTWEHDDILAGLSSKPNFEILYILPFNKSQIKEFLRNRSNFLKEEGIYNYEEFLEKIMEIEELRDLSERPVLLDLIVRTIPKIKDKPIGEINPADLFDRYTRFWIEREERKGRRLIDIQQKRLFMSELASHMVM
ncbi:MAG: DUF2034 domain-containing protein, partial [Methanomassiliicoccales archaeon]